MNNGPPIWGFLIGLCWPLVFWAFWHALSVRREANNQIAGIKNKERTVKTLEERIEREERAVKALEGQAVRAAEILTRDYIALKQKTREIEDLRSAVLGEINFHLLANKHNESRLFANEWHEHKRDAIEVKKGIARGVNTLRRHVSDLTNARDGLGAGRVLAAKKITEARHSIEHMANVADSVQVQIDRSGTELDRYNTETGKLRDHIRDNCGPRGRRWYDDLQERTRRRRIDNFLS